ncbi:DUF4230 domain-containing protein [Geodermatophilus obscurus]|uniref:Putative secreted protein n=1 Tax=Geodermatophilus obscurus (strain ATCC 25078 / DSM 43160 / JCM 3152 / CCUG 61914 / KCC A-0152 / KCTC 9177 / NBRC 13315 / NRRL B-3577 / G-20) TaxID=526225 RepID=D2SAH0_GEOOG|nr:DUF4230 domain-containing protein [Geodermatophilus obscurus]ADB73899.1 putative secreted protein [Geodermatophilus obscurus DSM 43160]
MPTLLPSRPVSLDPAPRRRRRLRPKLVAAGIGLALLVPAGFQVADWLPDNPLGQDVVDRSTPPLLLALEDLSEYHAATGTFQVVVDREVDTRYVPSVISGEQVSFLATGTADAYVDLEGLDAGRVTLSPDGTSATIALPAPQLGEVRIDPAQSRVLDRDRGLLQRVGDALEDNPVDDSELYALAEDRLAAAATRSDLRERAEANTRDMLTGLARSLGVQQVEVTFDEPADGDG